MKYKIGDKVVFVEDRESLSNLQSDLIADMTEGDKTGAFCDKILAAVEHKKPFTVSEINTADRSCGVTLNGKDVGYMFEEERLEAFKEGTP